MHKYMSNIILHNLNAIAISSISILIVFFAVLLILVFIKIKKRDNISVKFDELYLKIKKDIKFSVTPNFIKMSPEIDDLVDLAVEVWRMEQRIAKSTSDLPENQLKGLENSIQKLRRYLEKYDIEIIDYKNMKYNEGLNLDILSIEKDSALSESIVKETIEPTIMHKGQVVRKAKIILLSNH